MKLALWGSLVLACACLAGCSSGDDDSNGGGSGSGGAGAGPSVERLNPPPNVDVAVCKSTAASDTDSSACFQCCGAHGFQGSTDYDGRCVCGNPLDTAAQTVCANDGATEMTCSDCCDGAGYGGYAYSGFVATMNCTCFGKFDASVCKSTLSASNPDDACRVCCLNHGYLGMSYIGFGTPECDCQDI